MRTMPTSDLLTWGRESRELPRPTRIINAIYLLYATRNQVQHHVDRNLRLFRSLPAARFTTEVPIDVVLQSQAGHGPGALLRGPQIGLAAEEAVGEGGRVVVGAERPGPPAGGLDLELLGLGHVGRVGDRRDRPAGPAVVPGGADRVHPGR